MARDNQGKTVGQPAAKRRRGPLFFQVLVVAGLLAMVWLSFGQNVLSPAPETAAPEKLLTLELVNVVEGGEALSRVDRLHGSEIDLVSAYIADYARGADGATVWVGLAADAETAAELLEMMVRGIRRGGTGFGNLREVNVRGQTVFQVEGPGGDHFFYVPAGEREKVIWLTVNAAEAGPVLEESLKVF